MSNPNGYSAPQIWLHWLVALLIVPQYLLNEPIAQAWRALERGRAITPSAWISLHVAVGVVLLALVAWRVLLRRLRGAPLPPAAESRALQLIGKLTHGLLYLLLVALAASGGVAWFLEVEAAAEFHEVATTLLLVLVGLHVLGALYHQFVLKTDVLSRMKRPD